MFSKQILFIFVALFAVLSAFAESSYRIFTSSNGKQIEAAIVKVSGGKVTIKRKGGSVFTTPINIYSQVDQDYIKKWAKSSEFSKSADGDGEASVEISAKLNTGKRKKAHHLSWGDSTDRHVVWFSSSHYSLNLQNKTGLDFKNLKVQYVIFVQHNSLSKTEDESRNSTSVTIYLTKYHKGDVKKVHGEVPISELNSYRRASIDTLKVRMKEERYNNFNSSHSRTKFKGPKKAKSEILGIRVKVLHEGKVIGEMATDPDLK